MNNPSHLTIPVGAWDCHVHVVGPRDAYPMLEDRQYTPGLATLDDLKAHLGRHGLSRAVIIQPSFYGVDNRCMLDTLERLDGAGRGIAVLPEDVSAEALKRLAHQGIRGIRVNLESAAVRDPSAIGAALSAWAARIAPLDWHIQIYAAPALIAAAAEQIAALPVTTVLDHFAMLPASTRENDDTLRAVLALLRHGSTYVKLSAPYRISPSPLRHQAEVARLAQALYAANPDRIVWGTDWPHTNREEGVPPLEVSRYRDIPPAMLTQALLPWAPDAAVLQRILVTNPERLYG